VNLRPRPASILITLIVAVAATVVVRAALNVTRGLRVEYFSTDQPAGLPTLALITPEVSTSQILLDWSGPPPPVFSARWFGYLTVGRPGLYAFATTSDDGSVLSVGGQRVVDNGGVHGAATQTGQIELSAGSHFVVIEYFQGGGFFEMAWSWAPDGEPLRPVPSWLLSPGREDYRALVAARTLDVSALLCVAAALATVAYLAVTRGRLPAAAFVQRHPQAAGLVLFVFLAVAHTWPLAMRPATLSRSDNGDTILNEWIMAWVAHQAPRDPLHLFDANIFHPNRDTLAYSEPLLVQSALGAPVMWLGGSPVLAYNLVLIAGLALTGWTTSFVVGRWTGDYSAGLLAGALAGVNAHTLTRVPHMQAQHAEFLPLALFALDRVLATPSLRHALSLALWFVLQALTSIYFLVFTAFAMVTAAVVRLDAWLGGRRWRVALALAVSAAVAALALLPVLLPYWRVSTGQGLTRSLADASMYSATWSDYLMTPGRFHRAVWSERFVGGTAALFPGLVGLALTATAVLTGVAFRDPRARMCLAMGLVALALSFGTRLPGYATLYELVPLLQAIRAPARIGYLVIVAVAVLAGFGLVQLRRRVAARSWPAVAFVTITLATLEPFVAPLTFSEAAPIPAIYDRLRPIAGAVVVELPLPQPRAFFHNARYLMHSTRHWKPMLNGYSGFVPGSYRADYEALKTFPDAASIAALQDRGVTHVFVHLEQHAPTLEHDLARIDALRKIDQEGTIALYELRRE
jgi:hypothetical protein